jgi:hypothetical protein
MKERGLVETGLGLKQVADSCEHNNKLYRCTVHLDTNVLCSPTDALRKY